MEYVFAYGTLRPSLYPDSARRFDLRPLGGATLDAEMTMFNLGAFPALVSGAGAVNRIVGEVVEVADLALLDRYESYWPGGQGMYDRAQMDVALDMGHVDVVVKAWVYFMHEDRFSAGGLRLSKKTTQVVRSHDWADVARRVRR